ncbi:MAG: phosphate ABC transporter permease PstA [Coprococcus sp.]
MAEIVNTEILNKEVANEEIVDIDAIEAINKRSFADKWAEYKKKPGSLIMMLLVYTAAVITVLAIGFLLIYVLVKGIPNLSADLFKWEYTSDNCSMLPALINTVFMTLLSLLIAGPVGIFAAIYLVEYAKSGNKIVGIVRITAETLTGIPSIVYGLFGMLFFTNALGWKLSLLSGSFTLAIMVLPVIMRTTEEALLAVPKSYREGSFGLGAGKLRTVFKVVLPSAVPGILSGIILATGRIVGETAALIYTAGSVAEVAKSIFSSTRTLSVHMYLLSKEGFHTNQAYATAVVLLLLVVMINFASDRIAKKCAADKAQ